MLGALEDPVRMPRQLDSLYLMRRRGMNRDEELYRLVIKILSKPAMPT